MPGSELQLRLNTLSDWHQCGAMLEQTDHRLLRRHRREPLANLGSGQRLVRDAMLPRAGQRARHEQPIGLADHQRAGLAQQRLIGRHAQLAPQLIGPLHQRDIRRVFVVGLANHPRFTVRRAEVVRRPELVKPNHRDPAARQMPGRRRPHRPKPNNRRVVVGHAPDSKRTKRLCRVRGNGPLSAAPAVAANIILA